MTTSPSTPAAAPRPRRRGIRGIRFTWFLLGFAAGISSLHFLQVPADPSSPVVYAGPAHVVDYVSPGTSACNGARTHVVMHTGESMELVYIDGRWLLMSLSGMP